MIMKTLEEEIYYYESLIVHQQAEILLPKFLNFGSEEPFEVLLPPNILSNGSSSLDFAIQFGGNQSTNDYYLVDAKKRQTMLEIAGDKNKRYIGFERKELERFMTTDPSDLPFEVDEFHRFLAVGVVDSGEMYMLSAYNLKQEYEIGGKTFPFISETSKGQTFVNFSVKRHFTKIGLMDDDARRCLLNIQDNQLTEIPRKFIPKTLPPQVVAKLNIIEDSFEQKPNELADNSVADTSTDDDVDIDDNNVDKIKKWDWKNDPRVVLAKEIVTSPTSNLSLIKYHLDIDNNWLIHFGHISRACGFDGGNSVFQEAPTTLATIARAFQDITFFITSYGLKRKRCYLKVSDAIKIIKKFITLKEYSTDANTQGHVKKAKESVKIMEVELAELQATGKISPVTDTNSTAEPATQEFNTGDVIESVYGFRVQMNDFISSFNELCAELVRYGMPEDSAKIYTLKHMTDYDFDVDEFIETFIKK